MKEAQDHICPRCNGAVPNAQHRGEYPGALSRVADVEICSACGTDEAMENWQGRVVGVDDKGDPVRVFDCTPRELWPVSLTYGPLVNGLSEAGRRLTETAAVVPDSE